MRIALIPAYEPEPVLLKLLAELRNADFAVVIVDDGSGSDYSKLFHQAGQMAEILTNKQNCGKGSALKTGLQYILNQFSVHDTVVTMDADGQHSVRDAVRVCEEAEQYTDSLILGSRALRENVPLRSRFGNGVTRFVYRLATGLNVHDTQTGLRAFHADMIPVLLKISGDRYEYEMNELLLFARKKRPIREVEIATIYLNNNQSSHFNTTKDSCRIYKEIFKFSASSFFCFLLDYGLFSLLTVVTAGMGTIGIPVSNLASRIVSASANYTLNRRLVFKSKNDGLRSALSYFALAAVILAGNTLILTTLVSHLGMNRYLAKILTEVLFFTLSWLVQRSVIFKRKRT